MPEIMLKPASPSDTAKLYAWRQDAEARQYNREQNPEVIRRRLEQCGSDLSDESHLEYSWIVECDAAPVGVVLVKNIDWEVGCGEIGYLLSEQARGRGIGTAAVRELVRRLFTGSRLQKLVAKIHPDNEKSWRILEKLGFKPSEDQPENKWIYYEISRERFDVLLSE